MENAICFGCQASVPAIEDPNQYQSINFMKYGVAAPECVAVFCSVLAKEQAWAGYPPIHRLLVDSYAVQHPPHAEKQKELQIEDRYVRASRQSVVIHLLALYLAFEKKVPLPAIAQKMDAIIRSGVQLEDIPFTIPPYLGTLTIIDIDKASTFQEYEDLVWQWARSAWQAWENELSVIENLYFSQ